MLIKYQLPITQHVCSYPQSNTDMDETAKPLHKLALWTQIFKRFKTDAY